MYNSKEEMTMAKEKEQVITEVTDGKNTSKVTQTDESIILESTGGITLNELQEEVKEGKHGGHPDEPGEPGVPGPDASDVAPEVPDTKPKKKSKKKEEEFEQLVVDTMGGRYGTGRERMIKLGDQYAEVQKEITKRIREERRNKK